MLKAAVFFLVVLFSLPAFAHRPYAVKQGILEGPSGISIIKERVYGDGIFVADPANLQIRSRNGSVLASSPVGQHVGTFCPSVSFCWAFPYGQLIPFCSGWKIDVDSVQFDQPPPNYQFNGTEEEEFRAYLEDPSAIYVRGVFLSSPESRTSHSGFVRVPWSALLSPFIIIMDNFWRLIIVLGLTAGVFILYRISFRKTQAARGVIYYAAYLLALFLFSGYVLIYSTALFFVAFTASTPLFYMLLFIVIGARVGSLVSKKLLRGSNAYPSS